MRGGGRGGVFAAHYGNTVFIHNEGLFVVLIEATHTFQVKPTSWNVCTAKIFIWMHKATRGDWLRPLGNAAYVACLSLFY